MKTISLILLAAACLAADKPVSDDVIYDQVRDFLVDTGSELTRAINLVEYSGDDRALVQTKVERLFAEMSARVGTLGAPHGHTLTWKPNERLAMTFIHGAGVA